MDDGVLKCFPGDLRCGWSPGGGLYLGVESSELFTRRPLELDIGKRRFLEWKGWK